MLASSPASAFQPAESNGVTTELHWTQGCTTTYQTEVPRTQGNIFPPAETPRFNPASFQCCLIAFLQLTETKLKTWTAKYGHLDKVVQLLDQYRNFVSKNHIFQEFNKAYIDMQAVIEEYKRDGNIGKFVSVAAVHFTTQTAFIYVVLAASSPVNWYSVYCR